MAGEGSSTPALVWFRQDLRLSDNPALAAAVERGPVIPVFIWSPEEEGAWPPGGASRWWLDRSLAALAADLERRGSKLILRRGPAGAALDDLIRESGANAVFWNRRYEPAGVARDSAVKSRLREQGIVAESFNGSLLFEPLTIRNSSGNSFRVFTAFWQQCVTQAPAEPAKDAPRRFRSPEHFPCSLALPELGLAPKVNWAAGLCQTWQPGEAGARNALKRFREEALGEYPDGRNRPGVDGTSRLSPHLHFGEISPGQIRRTLREMKSPGEGSAMGAYIRQVGWREFAYHLLYHHPQSPDQPLRPEFAGCRWRNDPRGLRAWAEGKTGYPLVDAGMRELWRTGWMHNRVRMVTASFLVKHLLIDWREGEAWFWDTLVDADLANNTLGWQWVAGCGVDASPYFRIFNPVMQGEKFDPSGDYVRRWVPELGLLPGRWIHQPWNAPAGVLEKAGVRLGKTYPLPVVGHAEARARALGALEAVKKR